jgi:hypothetical protein
MVKNDAAQLSPAKHEEYSYWQGRRDFAAGLDPRQNASGRAQDLADVQAVRNAREHKPRS